VKDQKKIENKKKVGPSNNKVRTPAEPPRVKNSNAPVPATSGGAGRAKKKEMKDD